MLRSLANSLKISCVALAFGLALPLAGEQAKPPAPAVGATREQIVTLLGEPKSQLKAGAREVIFYTHWKLTLRNDVVMEVEELFDEPPPKRAAPAEAPASPPGAAAAKSDQPAPEAIAPDGDPEPLPPPPKSTAAPAAGKASVTEADAPLEIKSIRRPSAGKTARPPAPTKAPTASSPTKVVAGAPSAPTPAALPEAKAPPSTPTSAEPKGTASSTVAVAQPDSVSSKTGDTTTEAEPGPAETDETAAKAPAVKSTAASKLLFRRHRVDPGDPEVRVVTTQTYVLAVVTILGGIGYLFWRRAQRAIELAATTVSRTPFETPVVDSGAMFTPELLGKLDSARFERLVASYYAKTGVVAESTKAGPEAAVHIKIFWKGEPKPFAGVQCHARPSGLIPAKPLQDLFTALSDAEIRRGYVVTTGRFSVEARDFAEEKHFTLLTGDMLVEKLNALPAPARSDLLKETSTEPASAPDRIGG